MFIFSTLSAAPSSSFTDIFPRLVLWPLPDTGIFCVPAAFFLFDGLLQGPKNCLVLIAFMISNKFMELDYDC